MEEDCFEDAAKDEDSLEEAAIELALLALAEPLALVSEYELPEALALVSENELLS